MPSEKTALLVKKAALVIEKHSNQLLVPYDLTHTQYKILRVLYSRADRSVRQVDIEQKFAMTNPTVTNIIQNLEKKQLVQRVENPADKRSKLLCLTQRARELEPEIRAVGDRIERDAVKNLTAEECDLLDALLKKIIDA